MLLWQIYGNAYLAAFRLELELVTFCKSRCGTRHESYETTVSKRYLKHS